jgi:hypothetical protein
VTRHIFGGLGLAALLFSTAFCHEDPPPSHVAEPKGPICEPISECGFWGGCANLAPIEGTTPTQYRVLSGEAKGRVFVRHHSCSPAVGAGETCLEYCSGGGGSVVCFDGLEPRDLKCDESARPQRATFQCVLQPSGECVKAD